MLRRLLCLALIPAILAPSAQAAARRVGDLQPRSDAHDLPLPARAPRLEDAVQDGLDLSPDALALSPDAALQTQSDRIDFAPRGNLGVALENALSGSANVEPNTIGALAAAVAAQPRGPQAGGAQGAHWNLFFQAQKPAAELADSGPVVLSERSGSVGSMRPALLKAGKSGGATLYSTAVPAVALAPWSGDWIWSKIGVDPASVHWVTQHVAAIPWWGKLGASIAAVYALGRVTRTLMRRFGERRGWSEAKKERYSKAAEVVAMLATSLGLTGAFADIDKSTAELLSVVIPTIIKGVTDDYVLGTFLLINHPFYIGERIRVNVDDEGEKDYIVRGVTWNNMVLDDAEDSHDDPRFWKKVPHSEFIKSSVTIYRPHARAGALWVRKIAFSVAPRLVAAPAPPVQPLQKPPLKTLILSGALTAALIAATVAAHHFAFSWLTALAGLAAMLPLAFFAWKLMQTIGAKQLWDPGAAKALARIGIGVGLVLGVHFVFGFAGFADAEKLLGILGLGIVGFIILTLIVIKPLVSRYLIQLFDNDIVVGNKVKLSGKYTGTVRDLIANYVVLRLTAPKQQPDSVREVLVPYSAITTRKQVP